MKGQGILVIMATNLNNGFPLPLRFECMFLTPNTYCLMGENKKQCFNPNLLLNTFWTCVATLALGSQPRQRGCKGAGQKKGSPGVKANELQGYGPRGSPGVKAGRGPGVTSHTPGVLESVREYEGVNPHTPKATPTLGDGVPVDSRNFREQLQGSNLNVLWRSLYHWKDLEA